MNWKVLITANIGELRGPVFFGVCGETLSPVAHVLVLNVQNTSHAEVAKQGESSHTLAVYSGSLTMVDAVSQSTVFLEHGLILRLKHMVEDS